MSKISTYPSADTPLLLSDRLIGTEAIRTPPTSTPLATKNFSLGELLQLFSSNFPAASLQAVLNTGNTATQNITLVGTIDVTLIKPDNIEDTSGSQGTVFQYLSKGASSINWVDLPIDSLQAVLDKGNTATQNINLIGNITSTKIIPGNIQDELSNLGIAGQFLSKTATGIRWVNTPTPATPGLGDVLATGNTAINDINLTGNFIGTSFVKTGGTNLQYLMADGSVTTGGSYVLPVATISTLGGVKIGSGVNVALDGTISVSTNYQAPLSLTTIGSSGASTFISNILNIPTYSISGLGGQPLAVNLTSLSGLTYVSTSFVKMTAAGTFTLDTDIYYLASNPSNFTSNLGTVTSVAALTLGTSGTDLSSTVTNGATTPVITLNVPTASATNRGALSAADWTTFNNKQDKSLGAYKMLVNNTNAAANATETNFRQIGKTTYTGTPTWTGTTAPSGATNHSYNWIQIGNLVQGNLTLVYATTGTANTAVIIPFPSDLPTPIKPDGLTAALNGIYQVLAKFEGTETSSATGGTDGFIRSNAANNGFEFSVTQVSIGTKIVRISFQYFTA
jgi:hypothetical protein